MDKPIGQMTLSELILELSAMLGVGFALIKWGPMILSKCLTLAIKFIPQ